MDQEDEKILEKLQAEWDEMKSQAHMDELFSEEHILKMIHSHHRSSYHRQRAAKRWSLLGSAIGLLGAVAVLLFYWGVLGIAWRVLLCVVGLFCLWLLVEMIYDLYLMRKGNLLAPVAVVRDCVNQLNINENRRMRWFRFFVEPNPQPRHREGIFVYHWGRMVATTLCVLLVVGTVDFMTPHESSAPLIAKQSINEEAPVATPLIVEKKQSERAPYESIPPQEEVLLAKVEPAVKEQPISTAAKETQGEIEEPIAQALEVQEPPSIDDGFYMEVSNNRYQKMVKVRCNIACVAESVVDDCNNLAFNEI